MGSPAFPGAYWDNDHLHCAEIDAFLSKSIPSLVLRTWQVVTTVSLDSAFKPSVFRYSSLVDNPSGVNNYAEGALALHQGRCNDSKLWTTSLTKDRVLGMDSVRRFMAASRAARASLIPPGEGDTVLFTRQKPKDDTNSNPDATNGAAGAAPSEGEEETTTPAPLPPLGGRGPQPLFRKMSEKVRFSGVKTLLN